MKNKVLILGLIILVIVSAAALFYFSKKGDLVSNLPENVVQENGNGAKEDNQTDGGQLPNKLVTDDFEINIPEGWIQITPTLGASAMAVNNSEQSSDPAVQKINFRSYLAVSYDTLQGRSLSEYMQAVKVGLQELVPEVSFAEERDAAINGRPARAVEADMAQQGVNFKVLMVAVRGEGDDVWTISFNTTKSNWDGYKEAFSSVADSFSLKK